MTSHNSHHGRLGRVLMDGCPRCAEHAEHPIQSLDDDNLRRLITIAVRDDDGPADLGELDRRAAGVVRAALTEAGMLARVDATAVRGHLARYGVLLVPALPTERPESWDA